MLAVPEERKSAGKSLKNTSRRASLAIKQLANSFFGDAKLMKKQDHEVVGGIYDWLLFDKKYGSELQQDTAHKLVEEVCCHPIGLEESESSHEFMANSAILHDAFKRRVPNMLRTVLLSRDHYSITQRIELRAVFAKFELTGSISEPAAQLPKDKKIRCFTKHAVADIDNYLNHRRLSLDAQHLRQGVGTLASTTHQEGQTTTTGSRPTGLQALKLTELYTLPESLIGELIHMQKEFQSSGGDSSGHAQQRDPRWLLDLEENLLKRQSRDLHEVLGIQKNLLLKRISSGRM